MYPHPPMKYNFNCVQWRVDVLHSEEVETVFRKHVKTTIDPLFKAFSHEYPDRQATLEVTDSSQQVILQGGEHLTCHVQAQPGTKFLLTRRKNYPATGGYFQLHGLPGAEDLNFVTATVDGKTFLQTVDGEFVKLDKSTQQVVLSSKELRRDELEVDIHCTGRTGRHLAVEDWFKLLDGLQVLPVTGKTSLRNTWDRSWIWQISVMSHDDELSQSHHLMLSWPEFLEALARLVGILTARKHSPTKEELEKTDYGLGYCSPSYAFCMESTHVGDKKKFAQLLDTFLSQPSLKQLLQDHGAKRM
jgi:hypothetical protein